MNIVLICTSENQNIFSQWAGQTGQIRACGASVLPDRQSRLHFSSCKRLLLDFARRESHAVNANTGAASGGAAASPLIARGRAVHSESERMNNDLSKSEFGQIRTSTTAEVIALFDHFVGARHQ
jgi:hypothetical protein